MTDIGTVSALSLCMNATDQKRAIKTVTARLQHLRAELADPYTVSLGRAAVKCVQETISVWEEELARLQA